MNITHDGTNMNTKIVRRGIVIGISSTILVSALCACASPVKPDPDTSSHSPGPVVDASAIENQLVGIGGLASSQVSFQTTGFSRRAIINLFVTTDDPGRLSAIQDFATRSLFTNTVLPRPAEILEIFSWSPTLGPGADNQSPRAAIVAAIGDKAGVSIRKMGPNAPVYAIIDTSKFDGGIRSTTPPAVPSTLTTAPPPITSPPTAGPTTAP